MPTTESPVAIGASTPAADRRTVVGHVLPWATIGGTEWGTVRLARALGPGFDHRALVPRGADRVAGFLEERGIPCTEYDMEEPSLRRPLPFLRATRELARLFRDAGVDQVHCADLPAAFHAAPAAALARIPVTSHIRCQHRVIPPRYRLLLRPVRHFAFVSEDARRSFGLAVPRGRATVVGDAIGPPDPSAPPAPDLRAALGLPAGAALVGMVARVAAAKDFPTLIDAVAIIRRQRGDVFFVIIGDHSSASTYREHYRHVRELLDRSGVADAVRFTGELPALDGVWDQLQASVLVTHTEGLPLVLLEAMAAGCPVVATAVGGVPELVQDGWNGFTHAHGDAAELAAKLLRVLDEPATAASLAATASADVAKRYSYERLGETMTTVFARAARRLA
jgi:glycosyltransferase involved in cell wall biosynthesis